MVMVDTQANLVHEHERVELLPNLIHLGEQSRLDLEALL